MKNNHIEAMSAHQEEEECKKRLAELPMSARQEVVEKARRLANLLTAELRDRDLFTQPGSSCYGDCPICCLPLPIDMSKSSMTACCSNLICDGCAVANKKREFQQGLEHRCAFCREPVPKSQQVGLRNAMKRVKKNDPAALWQVGTKRLIEGDCKTALKYWTQAAELGDVLSHYELSVIYREGHQGGVEKDMKKAIHHGEQAAIGGHPDARFNLGCFEALNGRFERAKKHYIIAANLGCNDSLKRVMKLYADGHASKEEYFDALRAYQAAVDAMKSIEREEADAYHRAVATTHVGSALGL